MAQNFTAQVDSIIAKNEQRITALTRESVQRVTDIAQKPVGKGGKMRVDTGFLRASGQASLTGMPTGPTRGDAKAGKNSYDSDEGTITATLSQMQPGDTYYFGWTANYARYREIYDGFLGSAVQNWKKIVAQVTVEIRGRFG